MSATLAWVAGFVPANAADGEPSVSVLSPVIGSKIPLGDVPVTMAIDLGGESSGRVDVSLGYYVTGSVEISAGSCDTGCQVTVPLHIGDWDHAGWGSHLLSAKLTTVSGAQTFGGGDVFFDAPSSIADLQHVRDGQLFHSAVVDTTGTFRVTSGYPRDDIAEVRVIDLATKQAVLTKSAPFTVARGIHHDALIDLDFAAVPNGNYRVETKARNTAGFYGEGRYTFVRVNHAEPAVFDTGAGVPLVAGQGQALVGGNLALKGPLLSGSKPDVVKLTVDGVERQVQVIPAAWKSVDWQDPTTSWQNLSFTMAGPELAVGTHQATLRLLDTAGRIIGKPTTKTITVTNFAAKVTAPALVVGRTSTVGFEADPPATRQFDYCDVGLSGPGGASAFTIGSWCSVTKVLPNLRTTAAVTPRLAGANGFVFYLHTTDGHSRNVSVPATVYAARRATVSAPAIPYGARGTAKVVVQDSRSLNVWSAAPAGITVSLQRQAVGTTRWVTVGSAKTVTGGVASVPFLSATNGAFRAVLASSVPRETVISRPIGAVSSATVSWRLAPRTAVRGRGVTYEVLANPYDAGSLALLQVRKVGATKWTTAKTVAVPTTRIARFAYAFPSAGTWYVRVYRPATKQHAAGLSIVVPVKVS